MAATDVRWFLKILLNIVLMTSLITTPAFAETPSCRAGSEPTKASKLSELKKEVIDENLLFMGLPIAAGLTGLAIGDAKTAFYAASGLAASLAVVNISVPRIINTFRKLGLKPSLVVFLTAVSTNMPEFFDALMRWVEGAGFASAAVAGTSNFWNVAGLLTVSLLWALKQRGVKEGVIQPSDPFFMFWKSGASRNIAKSFMTLKLREMGGPMAVAVLGMVSAYFYFDVLSHAQATGDVVPLMQWIAVNSAASSYYIWRTAFSRNSRMNDKIQAMLPEHFQAAFEAAPFSNSQKHGMVEARVLETLKASNKYVNKPDNRKFKRELFKVFKKLRKDIKSGRVNQQQVEDIVSKLNQKEVVQWMQAAGVVKGPSSQWTLKRFAALALWVSVMSLGGQYIEPNLTVLADSLPLLASSMLLVGIIGGFATSVGEFRASKELIVVQDDRGAVNNIASSGLSNLLIISMFGGLTLATQ